MGCPCQVLADFDGLLEDGPYYSLIARWSGQRTFVSVVLGAIHIPQEGIKRYVLVEVNGAA